MWYFSGVTLHQHKYHLTSFIRQISLRPFLRSLLMNRFLTLVRTPFFHSKYTDPKTLQKTLHTFPIRGRTFIYLVPKMLVYYPHFFAKPFSNLLPNQEFFSLDFTVHLENFSRKLNHHVMKCDNSIAMLLRSCFARSRKSLKYFGN